MNRTFNQWGLFLLFNFVILGTITSCKKQAAEEPAEAVAQGLGDEIKQLKAYLSSVTQVPVEKIDYNEKDQRFFLDGDMMMPLSYARDHKERSKTGGEQRRFDFIMNATAASNVVVFVRTDMPAAWVTAIDQAINNWNSTDCLIRMSRTTNSAAATISMAPYFENSTTIAFASFPDAVGNAGPTINVNTNFNGLSASRKQFAMTHEFGHCFGFTHTNQSFGAIIPGTPVSDPNSVMNATVLDWNGFTPYDIIAYGVVYPRTPGTQRFLRYFSAGATNHFYTANVNELGAGGGGYVFEGGAGYVFPSQVAGTVPIYRYYSAGATDHFYTANFAELGFGGGGYAYEGVAGYANPTQVAGSRPLYRYYNGGIRDHFYTTNFSELGGGAGGYVYEGIAAYVR